MWRKSHFGNDYKDNVVARIYDGLNRVVWSKVVYSPLPAVLADTSLTHETEGVLMLYCIALDYKYVN